VRRASLLLAIPAVLVLAFLYAPLAEGGQGESCSVLSSQEFPVKFNKDIRLLRAMVDNVEKTLTTVDEDKVLFAANRKKDFDIGEKEKLYTTWAAYLDYMVAFEG